MKASRTGFTLMECLVSIFVIMVGLLGTVALVHLGRAEMSAAVVADNAGAIGRAALREIKIRRVLDPRINPGQTLPSNIPRVPFVVDPMVRQYSNGEIYGWAGYPMDSVGDVRVNGTLSRKGFVPRYPLIRTSADPLVGVTVQMDSSCAARIFTSDDDLIFDYPADKSLRPTLLGGGAGVNGINPSHGHYSWIMMVSLPPGDIGYDFGNKIAYQVSTIVFYQRDLTETRDSNGNVMFRNGEITVPFQANDPPVNSPVSADHPAPTMGLGGGGVRLPWANSQNDQLVLRNVNRWADLKTDDWVLVIHKDTAFDRSDSSRPGNQAWYRSPDFNGACVWYRVLSIVHDNTSIPDSPFTDVMLTGPDWNPNLSVDAVIVMRRVVGVYTQSIAVERFN